MQVLNCPVDGTVWQQWNAHFAPRAQPFFISDDVLSGGVSELLASQLRWTQLEFTQARMPLSVVDTFQLYGVGREAHWVVWLSEEVFAGLPKAEQRVLLEFQRRLGRGGVASLDAFGDLEPSDRTVLERAAVDGRFVWWLSLWQKLTPEFRQRVLLSFIETDRLPCERHRLSCEHWEEIRVRFPALRSLAGTFASESGANCFSTVLAALGASEVAEVWLHPEPFLRCLEAKAAATVDLDALGTVLVWRDADEKVHHTALCLGNGWAFHKEAQAWFAPRQVMALSEVRSRWDAPGVVVAGYAVE